ncbi:MAG: Ig-like domain-containing protein [Candidatus Polarisedimenticolia bacterium]
MAGHLCIVVAALAAGAAWAGTPAIVFQADPGLPAFGTVVIRGLRPDALAALREMPLDEDTWSALFPVHTAWSPAGNVHPPIAGRWTVEPEAIRFTPRFPLATGIEYTARFDGALFERLTGQRGPQAARLDLTFAMPDPGTRPSTIVEAVQPGIEVVPENLLRLYVHFSAPMKEQLVGDAISIYDERGAEVELPFVEIPQGLWDPSRRRLTLIFHPGRIKREVGPHQAMGTPLREGARYRLVVEATLRDALGQPLARSYEWSFRVGPADRISPDPASFRILAPSGPSAPLAIDFPEPLDPALVQRLLGVEDAGRLPMRGTSSTSRDGMRWTFSPAEPWRPGGYSIVIDPDLEDLAGNTPVRLFDRELPADGGGAPAQPVSPIRLSFRVPA